MKLFLSSLIASAVLVALPASAAVVTSLTCDNPLDASTDWVVDRKAPAGFACQGGRLAHTVDDSGYSAATFTQTQGYKYLHASGDAVSKISVDLYTDRSWDTLNQRLADLWITGFNGAAVSVYGILGGFSDGTDQYWRGWNNGVWFSLGLVDDTREFNTLSIELVGSMLEYSVNDVVLGSVSALGSDRFGEGMLQQVNLNGPNNPGSRTAFFDNYTAENRVPEPGSLALAGCALMALGSITSRRRRQSVAGASA